MGGPTATVRGPCGLFTSATLQRPSTHKFTRTHTHTTQVHVHMSDGVEGGGQEEQEGKKRVKELF